MDVDNDVDANLLQQFSSMGTTDREVLVSQLQQLLGNQLSAAGCAFFLDMNNWNLQAAVCAYYDYEQPTTKVPSMALVRDVTIGEGESVPTNTNFTKTWKVQNTGEDQWPPGCSLRFIAGEQFGHRDRVMVDALKPGETAEISIEMVSPSTMGIYEGQWRMSSATGMYFGEVIWVILQVADDGLLGVTQQMSQFGTELGSPKASRSPPNPFASPSKDSLSDSPLRPEWSAHNLSMVAQHGSAQSSPVVSTPTLSSSVPSSVRMSLFMNSSIPPSDSPEHLPTSNDVDTEMS